MQAKYILWEWGCPHLAKEGRIFGISVYEGPISFLQNGQEKSYVITSFDSYSFYQPRIPTKTKKAVYKRSRNFSKAKIDTRSFRTVFLNRNGIQDKKGRQAIKMFRHIDGVDLGQFYT